MNKVISFDKGVCRDYSESKDKEWLLGNGIGGYSSSTIIGANTRKYHGLLIAPLDPPWERRLLLSKLEEEITIGGEKFQLSTNQYPNNMHPEGYKHQEKFRLDPFPTFSYSLADIKMEKTVFMPYNRNAVVINYKIDKRGEEDCKILLHPLINFRDIDSISKHEQSKSEFEQRVEENHVEIFESSEDRSFLFLGSDSMKYYESELSEDERWFKNFEYEKERERGFEFQEDHYNPGFFDIELERNNVNFNILAAGGFEGRKNFENLSSNNPEYFEKLQKENIGRLEEIMNPFFRSLSNEEDNWKYLLQSADTFIAKSNVILAGYHWFSAWGRDSLIALPGLTLVTGRHQLAKNILLTLADNQRGGLIPNRFSGGNIELNSADASLFFFMRSTNI